ncbi:MAG: lipid-A-disaccharide synthase [Parachlamydiaceae bacterium]
MDAPDLFIFAGEASGDLHGCHLLHHLFSLRPSLKVVGVGGSKMRSTSMSCLMPMESFQVMGFTDVLFALPHLVKQFYRIRNFILKNQPKAVVLIDYPGFNLRLAKHLRKKGFTNKIVHYIAPTVWAWGKERIQTMSQTLDLLLTIFPFEKHFFDQHSSLNTKYVGNPLISQLKNHTYHPHWQKELGLTGHLLALFPGSRKGDIERNLPLQIQAAQILLQKFPELKIAISCAHPHLRPLIEQCIRQSSCSQTTLVSDKYTYDLMKAASLAFSKSGTATLELALHGCPTVVTYELSRLNYLLAKYLFKINLPFYCIANILLKEKLFPEVIGFQLDPKELANEAVPLLNVNYRDYTEQASIRLKNLLSTEDASFSAAVAVHELI